MLKSDRDRLLTVLNVLFGREDPASPWSGAGTVFLNPQIASRFFHVMRTDGALVLETSWVGRTSVFRVLHPRSILRPRSFSRVAFHFTRSGWLLLRRGLLAAICQRARLKATNKILQFILTSPLSFLAENQRCLLCPPLHRTTAPHLLGIMNSLRGESVACMDYKAGQLCTHNAGTVNLTRGYEIRLSCEEDPPIFSLRGTRVFLRVDSATPTSANLLRHMGAMESSKVQSDTVRLLASILYEGLFHNSSVSLALELGDTVCQVSPTHTQVNVLFKLAAKPLKLNITYDRHQYVHTYSTDP